MPIHGNSHKNKNPYHLYGNFEHQTEDVFKYGISDDPIGEDGLSYRVRSQLRFANLAAGFIKFFANIILRNIPGRKEAERIEREHIDAYQEEHGKKPPGNLR